MESIQGKEPPSYFDSARMEEQIAASILPPESLKEVREKRSQTLEEKYALVKPLMRVDNPFLEGFSWRKTLEISLNSIYAAQWPSLLRGISYLIAAILTVVAFFKFYQKNLPVDTDQIERLKKRLEGIPEIISTQAPEMQKTAKEALAKRKVEHLAKQASTAPFLTQFQAEKEIQSLITDLRTDFENPEEYADFQLRLLESENVFEEAIVQSLEKKVLRILPKEKQTVIDQKNAELSDTLRRKYADSYEKIPEEKMGDFLAELSRETKKNYTSLMETKVEWPLDTSGLESFLEELKSNLKEAFVSSSEKQQIDEIINNYFTLLKRAITASALNRDRAIQEIILHFRKILTQDLKRKIEEAVTKKTPLTEWQKARIDAIFSQVQRYTSLSLKITPSLKQDFDKQIKKGLLELNVNPSAKEWLKDYLERSFFEIESERSLKVFLDTLDERVESKKQSLKKGEERKIAIETYIELLIDMKQRLKEESPTTASAFEKQLKAEKQFLQARLNLLKDSQKDSKIEDFLFDELEKLSTLKKPKEVTYRVFRETFFDGLIANLKDQAGQVEAEIKQTPLEIDGLSRIRIKVDLLILNFSREVDRFLKQETVVSEELVIRRTNALENLTSGYNSLYPTSTSELEKKIIKAKYELLKKDLDRGPERLSFEEWKKKVEFFVNMPLVDALFYLKLLEFATLIQKKHSRDGIKETLNEFDPTYQGVDKEVLKAKFNSYVQMRIDYFEKDPIEGLHSKMAFAEKSPRYMNEEKKLLEIESFNPFEREIVIIQKVIQEVVSF